MTPDLTPAAVGLLALLASLFVHDWFTTVGRSRPLLSLQALVFAGGGMLIAYPDIATRLARSVGIGRGVDFVLYPLVIWLVRESLLTRMRRRADAERSTELVRALACIGAGRAHSGADRVSAHSTAESASRTEYGACDGWKSGA